MKSPSHLQMILGGRGREITILFLNTREKFFQSHCKCGKMTLETIFSMNTVCVTSMTKIRFQYEGKKLWRLLLKEHKRKPDFGSRSPYSRNTFHYLIYQGWRSSFHAISLLISFPDLLHHLVFQKRPYFSTMGSVRPTDDGSVHLSI